MRSFFLCLFFTCSCAYSIPHKAIGQIKVYGASNELIETGSGFAIGHKAILTAGHVCEADGAASVTYEDHHAKIVKVDKEEDLCLVQTDEAYVTSVLTIAKAPPDTDDQVIAVGYPLGIPHQISTQGTFVGTFKIDGFSNPRTILAVPATHGNSGGPALNRKMEVIGVISRVAGSYTMISLAIPQSSIEKFIKDSF
jgi:S1-C subfamily serine protease